jgi:hypothetical protein
MAATTEHSEQFSEKHDGLNGNFDPEAQRLEALSQFRTAQSVQMSPELFEKLYLSPMNKVKGELRQTFANPTPMYDDSYLVKQGCVTNRSLVLLLVSFSLSPP